MQNNKEKRGRRRRKKKEKSVITLFYVSCPVFSEISNTTKGRYHKRGNLYFQGCTKMPNPRHKFAASLCFLCVLHMEH